MASVPWAQGAARGPLPSLSVAAPSHVLCHGGSGASSRGRVCHLWTLGTGLLRDGVYVWFAMMILHIQTSVVPVASRSALLPCARAATD